MSARPWRSSNATGFVGDTRLLIEYAHGFDVVRSGHRGGDEIVVQVSGRF